MVADLGSDQQIPLTGFIHVLEGFAECGVAAADQLPGVLQGSVFLLHLVDFRVQQICLLPELLSLLCGLMKRCFVSWLDTNMLSGL